MLLGSARAARTPPATSAVATSMAARECLKARAAAFISRPAAVDAGTATVPVRLAFAGPTNYPSGTPVQLDIEAEQHANVVLIPAPALVREGEETAVFVAKGEKAERRMVAIGLTDGMDVEIVSGVKEGEMVIVDGQAGLPDGAKITREAAEEDDEEPAEKPDDKGDAAKGGK